MSWNDYAYKENTHVDMEAGIYRCLIMEAKQAVSKTSGKNMLAITLRPSGTSMNVTAYIVDNDYFDDNLSRFLDAFPQLRENFSINTCFSWTGALGAARLVPDEKGYLATAKYPWIPEKKQEGLPPFEWKPRIGESDEFPVYQGITELPQTDDENDLPF